MLIGKGGKAGSGKWNGRGTDGNGRGMREYREGEKARAMVGAGRVPR